MTTTATTLRLPAEMKAEADAFAARLGISLNALLAIALRDYLDGRRTPSSGAPSGPADLAPPAALPAPASGGPLPVGPLPGDRREPPATGGPRPGASPRGIEGKAQAAVTAPRSFPAPKSRADPCPCGARDSKGHPVKWKHCHGRTE